MKRSTLVSNIEILMRSQLVKETLSSVLMKAGFSVLGQPSQDDNDSIVVVDLDDCKDPERVSAHQARGVKIVALTSEADSQEIGLDEIAPLSGILTYDLSTDAFVRSLRLICSGERVFPRDLALRRKPQGRPPKTDLRSDGAHLSPREKEMLSHLVAGHWNKMIGNHLGITEATVKVHLKSVLRKIRVENRTQAAIWALANLPELDTTLCGFV
jgi:two-component system, NarL family, nitrate/nitrite response regulator NarL